MSGSYLTPRVDLIILALLPLQILASHYHYLDS